MLFPPISLYHWMSECFIVYNLYGIKHLFFLLTLFIWRGPQAQHAPEAYHIQYYSAAMSGAMMHVMFWILNYLSLQESVCFSFIYYFPVWMYPDSSFLLYTESIILTIYAPMSYAQGCINHWCIGGFMHKSPRGRFQGPYWGGWRSRCIKELVRLAQAAPPITKLIRNQETTVRYMVCASSA